jgi:uncharacterized protein
MNGSRHPTLSVIVPCWNDTAALRESLAAMHALRGIDEIIVADASDSPHSRELAASLGARVAGCAEPNRGRQMNSGAALARGDVLLFHHADSVLTQEHVDSIRRAMGDAAIVGGAFHRKFDDRHPALRWLEPVARQLSEMGGTLYGDQSIFIRRDHFARLGGYADIPLMEDVEFSKRLRRSGRVIVLDPPMYSSPRRHELHGAWTISMLNGLMLALYRLGVSPHRLHRWYYRRAPVATPCPLDPAAE